MRPLPPEQRVFTAPRGGYGLELVAPAYTGPGGALGHEDAEFSLIYPAQDVALVVYDYAGARGTIDDIVQTRRVQVHAAGVLRFEGEVRFFLGTGDYRAASVAKYVSANGSGRNCAQSLVADSATGALEVLAWSIQTCDAPALERAVMGLRLETD